MENRVNNQSSAPRYFHQAAINESPGFFHSPSRNGSRLEKGARRRIYGQTAIIALLVLMLLAFAGAMFVTIVARNLFNAAHQNRLETADYYAEAGIHYADDQLTNSWEGADWRPPAMGSYASNDPDINYLSKGFTRFNTSNGRFLLQLSYVQDTSSSVNRYIKIISIGREGVVISNDPTTYNVSDALQTVVAYKAIGITDYARFETNIDNRSDIANIGVSSFYSSTVNPSDPNNNPYGIVTSGVNDFYVNSATSSFYLRPYPIATTLGTADAYMQLTAPAPNTNPIIPNPNAGNGVDTSKYTAVAGGGSFRSNATTRFYGINQIYLNSALDEELDCSGDILLDQFNTAGAAPSPYQTAATANQIPQEPATQPASLWLYSPVTPTNPSAMWDLVNPSSYNFTTWAGQVRDGERSNDSNGYPRSINRLDPPAIDSVNAITGLTRYRDMAIHCAPRNSTYAPAASAYGYGQVIYVDNFADTQNDSVKPGAGATLVDEWLNRNSVSPSSNANRWLGDIYRPPGVEISIGDMRYYNSKVGTTATSYYGIDMLRDDKPWKYPSGSTDSNSSNEMMVLYDELNASGNAPSASNVNPNLNPNNDVIIVTEGNACIHGIVSAIESSNSSPDINGYPRHILIVCYGTAYIDGNILRGNQGSSVAILAENYVCVNTTKFTAGRYADNETNASNSPLTVSTDDIEIGPTAVLPEEFSFGLANTATPLSSYSYYTSGNPSNPNLALYISGSYSGAGGSTIASLGLFQPGLLPGSGTYAGNSNPFAIGSVNFGNDGTTIYPNQTTVDLTGSYYLDINAAKQLLTGIGAGTPLQLWAQCADTAPQQYLELHHIAILPMDIRIEALLYAQTKSFFVIPGNAFNDKNPDDTVVNYANTNQPLLSGGTRPRGNNINNADPAQQRYPFADQPIDLKITIYGSVSEARPADIGAQTAWMKKWGWIPQYHGSKIGVVGPNAANGETAIAMEVSGHGPVLSPANPYPTMPSAGLTIIYNPQLAYPLTETLAYIRTTDGTSSGSPLPIVPRLPVCPGLLYSGEIPATIP